MTIRAFLRHALGLFCLALAVSVGSGCVIPVGPDSNEDAGMIGETDSGQTTDAGPTDGGGDLPDAGGPLSEIHFHGRLDFSDAAGPKCAWTGCGFSTQLNGIGLTVKMISGSGIGYQVVVDQQPASVIWASDSTQTYTVASGLAPGNHEITVFRRSEAFFGDTQFLEISPVKGTLVATPSSVTRRLEFVGDSITAGYGNEGCPFSTQTENGYQSYAAITARLVNAEAHILAWSGIGMAQNNDGSTTGTMPDRYDRIFPVDDASPGWNFSTWTPDAVVINLGTNDFISHVNSKTFVDAYVAFVRRVRANYPYALIFCIEHGSGSPYVKEIKEVVDTVDDSKVKQVTIDVPDWSGCDGHPSVVADQSMATKLAAELKKELGW